MRLCLKLRANNLNLPLAYKHTLQGVIYNMLPKDTMGNFYHDIGYACQEKKYKFFVFSDLFGKYIVENKRIIFEKDIVLYISSLESDFIKEIYNYLIINDFLYIDNQKVEIVSVETNKIPSFMGIKEIMIKTLSPIVTYTSKDKYFTYYKPSDTEFKKLVTDNIVNKIKAYNYLIDDVIFDIVDIKYENKKIVYFKNTFYEAYQCSMRIKVNNNTFRIIYDSGLSAKGSCGFGMIELKNEKNNLSL